GAGCLVLRAGENAVKRQCDHIVPAWQRRQIVVDLRELDSIAKARWRRVERQHLGCARHLEISDSGRRTGRTTSRQQSANRSSKQSSTHNSKPSLILWLILHYPGIAAQNAVFSFEWLRTSKFQ